ncbi:MAG: sigma-70 family RNA polymerase sigma factor [Saprospiraceae bacterium]|nr:sigma-70 family RNA polymerase sigma factor [Saprospiraceae bacterium]
MSKSKNQKVFEEELFPHLEALKTFAFHLTFNEDDANDLVQETYMKAHKFIENYISGTNGKAWLFKILKNAYINEYRKKSKMPVKVDFENAVHYLEASGKSIKEYQNLNFEDPDKRSDVYKDLPSDEIIYKVWNKHLESVSPEDISRNEDISIDTVNLILSYKSNQLRHPEPDVFDSLMGDEVTMAINSLPDEFRTVILLCDVEGFSYDEISKILDLPIGTVRSRLFRARNVLKEKLKKYATNLGYEDKRGHRNDHPD